MTSCPNKIEILAPVGSAEVLPAAVYAGADAVYLGLDSFNARRSAGNFTASALAEAVAFCHARNVRVYVTLNTLLFPQEINLFCEAARAVARAGADGVIVQDLGAAEILRTCVPQLPLHTSTQMSIHSVEGARMAQQLGYKCAVLAREMSLEEISAVREAVDIRLEAFVHGALCMSISGQCYMSAFLGGRSGNRGACAGPCRLPFSAGEPGACHLSLKDMSFIEHMPQLAQAGVNIVKIEGRLRDPEYVAAAVHACVCARDGIPYDTQLLRDAFSRSGFTDAYLTGHRDGTMFGVRTAQDSAAAKAAAPKLRELYRREAMRVPVHMTLELQENSVCLTVTDENGNKVQERSDTTLALAQKDPGDAYCRALEKTGGTPFYAKEIRLQNDAVLFAPGGEINELRRKALEQLLAVRSALHPYAYTPKEFAVPARTLSGQPLLAARFEELAQVPADASALDAMLLPLAQWRAVPTALRGKTWLCLPRAEFGSAEKALQELIKQTENEGFAGYSAENIAHFSLLKGKNIFGEFGLNVANSLAYNKYNAMGAQKLTYSVENTLQADAALPYEGSVLLAYGYMPLMLTRACPLQNVHGCEGCNKKGTLTDRKNAKMAVRCKDGVRTVYNAVPIYMGDRQKEIPAQTALLYFTNETPERVGEVLEMFRLGLHFDAEFTRGLYYKGTDDI